MIDNDAITISNNEYFSLCRELEGHHEIFYKIWEMGQPYLTEKIGTAAVQFDKQGEVINYYFNPKFWQSLNNYNRCFVIAHESLHIILNHGLRIRNAPIQEIANIAIDVVVNEILINKFGFDRQKIQNKDHICWLDNIFPNNSANANELFEYYYNRIMKDVTITQVIPQLGGSAATSLDNHQYLGEIQSEDLKNIIDTISNELSNEEKQEVSQCIQNHEEKDQNSTAKYAGVSPLGALLKITAKAPPKKKKWESIIKDWVGKIIDYQDRNRTNWIRQNRRYTTLSSEFMLPSDADIDTYVHEKLDLWFFQDTSGSCIQYVDRFYQAVMSIPEDRFQIKTFCFDTKVYPVDYKKKEVKGGGGTSFYIIEEYIQKEIKQNIEKYPDAVWIISDGYGDNVTSPLPKKWYWFLSDNYKDCIQSGMNIFMLKDFE